MRTQRGQFAASRIYRSVVHMFSIDRHYQTMPIAHLQFFEDSSVVFVNRYIPKFGRYILSIRLK